MAMRSASSLPSVPTWAATCEEIGAWPGSLAYLIPPFAAVGKLTGFAHLLRQYFIDQ
jgi:hypothetical protein